MNTEQVMKDQFVEFVLARVKRMRTSVVVKNPNVVLWLITAEERRAHPLLFAKHRVIEFLQRFHT